ncbi:hypothetical protein LIER_28513 [Lithospermum erythrorhizon]|uniref:Endonuclease/exonuclease/phosphatase domain-containing protein n=1 Tax=Lithospermum erythrorhizon TaxID=34254 RepID=A0AAV3RK18_LITER
MESCLPSWKYVHNISGNQVGWIIVAWDDTCCSVTAEEVMEQHVLCKVVMPSLPEFCLSAVYGATIYGDRRALWKSLVDNRVVDVPWVIIGDFNIFKDPAHFKGGKLPENVAMDEFKCCVDDLDVTELAGHGPVFTWCSNWASREGHLRKLDHVFCNLEWMQCLPQSYVHVQPPKVSDHCLLSIHLRDDVVSGLKPFKYHQFWEEHPDYAELIRGCWDGYAGDGSALDGLIGRLRKVKAGLKELNRNCFLDISGKVK